MYGPAALGEGRRVQNDEIVFPRLLRQLRQQVEHVGAHALHHAVQPVAPGVLCCAVHRELRHVHGGDVLCPASGGVQREGPRVGEAVQHRLAPGQPGHRQPVILLIQEEPGFLPVFKVHGVRDAVFRDVLGGALRQLLSRQSQPALALGHALQLPDGHVVALIHAPYRLPVLPQKAHQQGQHPVFDPLHAQAQHLRHQHALEPVHCQPRKAVRLAEDDAAAPAVRLAHHRFAVLPGVAQPPLPEGVARRVVVGVPGHQPHPDLGRAVVEPAAQPAALFGHHVHQRAVLRRAGHGQHLALIHPRVPAGDGLFALGRDGDDGIRSGSFHGKYSFSRENFS